MHSPPIDTLIVGQGLAGSALAWQLIRAGQRVKVIDDGHRSASSQVAAGLINPLAGMRFNRRPQTDSWLSAGERWYRELEQAFSRPFLHPIPMLRLLRSPGQGRFLERRRADPDSRHLLGEAFAADQCPEPVAAPYGGFVQHRTGYVDLPSLLSALRDWLHRQDALITADFDHRALAPREGGVALDGLGASRLVFCDGARLRDNPWFRELPLQPEKGEILNLRIDGWQPTHLINGAHWLVPLPGGEIRIGATHDHRHIDRLPTDAGRDELLRGLQSLRGPNDKVQLLRHQAGVRPGTRDRDALLGRHPDHPTLWVFNGFGARGALTIPWYAERMAGHLLNGEALPAEADIRRFR